MSSDTESAILVYNRATGSLEREIVMGERFVRLLYGNAVGRFLGETIFKRRVFSKLFGKLQDTRFSARKIVRIARELGIDLAEVERKPEEFRSFNDFFTRTLKREARPIDPAPGKVISPCDGRLLAYEHVDRARRITVKGSRLDLDRLLGRRGLAEEYSGGTMLVYRLCPADYHRFHFPESGVPGPAVRMRGPLHSVNPIALSTGKKILDRNERRRTLIETGNGAGTICMVEVGAMCVGSIVQTYRPGVPVKRGEEKGLFRFGGSTVIVLYERGLVSVDEDIVEHSGKGIETLVRVGTAVGAYLHVAQEAAAR